MHKVQNLFKLDNRRTDRQQCSQSRSPAMASLDPWSDDVVGLYASIVVLTVLAAISVALRFISRGRILHVLGPTDWFMVVTLVRIRTEQYTRHSCDLDSLTGPCLSSSPSRIPSSLDSVCCVP